MSETIETQKMCCLAGDPDTFGKQYKEFLLRKDVKIIDKHISSSVLMIDNPLYGKALNQQRQMTALTISAVIFFEQLKVEGENTQTHKIKLIK